MTEFRHVLFKGQVTKVDCQTKVTKLTIEVDTEKTELDKIKLLLDVAADISISDSQTLIIERPKDRKHNDSTTITPEGDKQVKKAQKLLEAGK